MLSPAEIHNLRRHTRRRHTRNLLAGVAVATTVLAVGCVPPPGTVSVPTTAPTDTPSGGTDAGSGPGAEPAPAAPGTGTDTASSVAAPPGWRLAFNDEFDGSALNTRVWKPYFNTYGDGNKELACLTPNNVTVSGGALNISARRETVTCPNGSVRNFTSGFLGTRENGVYFPRYGRFEIRAKVPHGQGLWPAFWLRNKGGSAFGEVDVMEYFHSQVPGSTTGTLHWNYKRNVAKKSTWFETPTATPGWHTWAVEILPVSGGVSVAWFLDGTRYLSYTTSDMAPVAAGGNVWDIALNMAVGGTWAGRPDDPLGQLSDLGICSLGQFRNQYPNCPSTGIRRAQFPATYSIDYVRVYTK